MVELAPETTATVVNRLRRAQGQIGGVLRMIEEGRDCQDDRDPDGCGESSRRPRRFRPDRRRPQAVPGRIRRPGQHGRRGDGEALPVPGLKVSPAAAIRTERPNGAFRAGDRPTVPPSSQLVARGCRGIGLEPVGGKCRQGRAQGRSRQCPSGVGRQRGTQFSDVPPTAGGRQSVPRTVPVIDGQQRDRQQAHPERGPRRARRHRHELSASHARRSWQRRERLHEVFIPAVVMPSRQNR